jgi:hypothetical protein
MDSTTPKLNPTVSPREVPPPILRLPAGFGVCWLCQGCGATWRGACPKCHRTGIVKVAA